MASLKFISQSKKLSLSINITFLFLSLFYIATTLNRPEFEPVTRHSLTEVRADVGNDGCDGIHGYPDYGSKCMYVKSRIECTSRGFINYLRILYCTFGRFHGIGHLFLLLWLLVLFYLLGNTAATYFCPSVESLSKMLKLPPTIAGSTLLSLGNGAPDVFASVVSFTRSSNGDLGLNSVLGGAFFVSCVVVGVISTLISSRDIAVDKSSFIRDTTFFLFSLVCLLLIVFIGKITLFGAIAFLSIYFCYVSVVCFMHFRDKQVNQDDVLEIGFPLLGYVDEEKPTEKTTFEDSNLALFNLDSPYCNCLSKLWSVLELPLYLPRRLTIPIVSEEKWSKPMAVTSAALAPMLLAILCNSEKHFEAKTSHVIYMIAGLVGLVLGNLAYVTTKQSTPPNKGLTIWLLGAFFMSVIWTYILAEELVSLLISLGHIYSISPSVLGLTVLAWGNSLGDMIANVAMALDGGLDGAQIAISGCYAGPMFNTLIGIGISLVISSWSKYPSAFVIPEDQSLFETLGFLIGGLLWAIVILPRNNMKLDRFLGGGLLAIYCCFIFVRIVIVFRSL